MSDMVETETEKLEDLNKRVYLHCRYKDKEICREYGARFDMNKKQWFYNPDDVFAQPDKLKQWLKPEKIKYCRIKYNDRDKAKKANLHWFKNKRAWGYYLNDTIDKKLLRSILVK